MKNLLYSRGNHYDLLVKYTGVDASFWCIPTGLEGRARFGQIRDFYMIPIQLYTHSREPQRELRFVFSFLQTDRALRQQKIRGAQRMRQAQTTHGENNDNGAGCRPAPTASRGVPRRRQRPAVTERRAPAPQLWCFAPLDPVPAASNCQRHFRDPGQG